MRRRTTSRPALVLAVVLALLIPLGCGGKKDQAAPPTTEVTGTTVAADPWITEVATAAVPEVQVYRQRPDGAVAGTGAAAQTGSNLPAIPRDGYLSAGVRVTPQGFAYANPTYFKNPLVFVVTEDAGDWLQVEVLARPNHQTGWVKRSDVVVSTHHFHLQLTKSTFELKAYDGDQVLADTKVVIGKAATFTPTGTFFITEKIARPPTGVYGPWIMATSGYSESLNDFDGGLPQMALHGTNNPSLIGTQASNGCVRMPNDVIEKLASSIPAGTPLTITD